MMETYINSIIRKLFFFCFRLYYENARPIDLFFPDKCSSVVIGPFIDGLQGTTIIHHLIGNHGIDGPILSR